MIDDGKNINIGINGSVTERDPQEEIAYWKKNHQQAWVKYTAIEKRCEELRKALQEPYINTHAINTLQMDSIVKLIPKLQQAHHTDLLIRINGKDETVQCDWLKHLVLP